MNIATAGVHRLRVASNGNIGIGVSSPNGKLDVVDSAAQIRFGGTNADEGGYLISTTASQAVMAGGGKWDGSNWIAKSTAASLVQNINGEVQFYTDGTPPLTPGTPFSPTPRVVIKTDGRVGVGTLAPSSGSQFHVKAVTAGDAIRGEATDSFTSGVIGLNSLGHGVQGVSGSRAGVLGIANSATGVGVYGNSDSGIGVYSFGGSWAGFFEGNVRVTGMVTQGSDARLKQGISNLDYGLQDIMRLRPVKWAWKHKPDQGLQLGFIAQEVETVLPELVTTDKDADQTKSLNYTGIVPVTIKAIQEQQQQIEEQKKQILQQQELNRKLEERLAALEALLTTKFQSRLDQ